MINLDDFKKLVRKITSLPGATIRQILKFLLQRFSTLPDDIVQQAETIIDTKKNILFIPVPITKLSLMRTLTHYNPRHDTLIIHIANVPLIPLPGTLKVFANGLIAEFAFAGITKLEYNEQPVVDKDLVLRWYTELFRLSFIKFSNTQTFANIIGEIIARNYVQLLAFEFEKKVLHHKPIDFDLSKLSTVKTIEKIVTGSNKSKSTRDKFNNFVVNVFYELEKRVNDVNILQICKQFLNTYSGAIQYLLKHYYTMAASPVISDKDLPEEFANLVETILDRDIINSAYSAIAPTLQIDVGTPHELVKYNEPRDLVKYLLYYYKKTPYPVPPFAELVLPYLIVAQAVYVVVKRNHINQFQKLKQLVYKALLSL